MIFRFIAVGLLALTLLSPAAQGQPATTEKKADPLYEKALGHAGKAEYAMAISLLGQARDQFSLEKNPEGAYKSAALSFLLKDEEASLKGSKGQPTWFRSSWLLADPLYSAQFIIPPVKPASFGGLLVLSRELKRIDFPGGGSRPVWGILDVRAVPVLQPGEAFAPDPGPCEMSGAGAADAGLAALVKVKGHENDAVWKEIRKAWRFNPRSLKIEDVPPSQVFCHNEALGT